MFPETGAGESCYRRCSADGKERVEATVDSLIGIAPLMTRNPFYATRARR